MEIYTPLEILFSVGGVKMMTKEIAQYINDLLADRERLLDEREDAIEETKAELANIYQAQKAMDYIIEEDN